MIIQNGKRISILRKLFFMIATVNEQNDVAIDLVVSISSITLPDTIFVMYVK